jgi:hypothetical protein
MRSRLSTDEAYVQKTKSITKGLHERIKAMSSEDIDDGVKLTYVQKPQATYDKLLHRIKQGYIVLIRMYLTRQTRSQMRYSWWMMTWLWLRRMCDIWIRPSTFLWHLQFELHDELFLHSLLWPTLGLFIKCHSCELSGVAHVHNKI